MVCKIGEHRYLESGLDNVFLVGVEICNCSCGEEIVTIPAVYDLHDLLSLEIVKKKSLLNSREIRFLRKNMGLSAKKLSKMMGVDNATISRWENNAQGINESRDRLLRLIYLNIKGMSGEEIKHVIEEDFSGISSKQEIPSPHKIPVDHWLKNTVCFTK